MALVLADRVQEYSTTTGTGTLTLSGAYAGFQTFAAGVGNGNTCYYTITSDSNQWEVGIGTVGVGTLARTTLISSSTGSFVSFVGMLAVFVTYPAEKALYLNADDDLVVAGQIIQGTSTGAVNGSLQLRKNITGGTTAYSAGISATVQNDVTGQASGFSTFINTVASSFTLGILKHYNAQQGTIGATSAVTNQYGYFADSALIGATNNYGFYGNIASGTGRFNFAAVGTAANVFVGTTSIGGIVGSESLRVTPVSSAVNYLDVAGAVTTGAPVISAAGSDTNIGITFTPKGTGKVITSSDMTVNTLTVGLGTNNIASNTAFGYRALVDAATSATSNVAVGYQAGQAITGGSFPSGFANTAVGYGVMANGAGLTGYYNTGVGYQSLLVVTTGYGNTAVGQGSGLGITTGNNNAILGSYTASASPISATGSNFVVLSDGAGTVRQTHNSSGAVAFDTAGTVFGTSGQILTSGGSSAVPTWTTVGTMSTQNANAVAITGGAIDGTTVGSTTAAAGAFTTLSASGRITTGTGVGAGSSATQITIGGTLVSASNVTRAVSNIGTAPSTSTTEFSSYLSAPSTTAAAYTITTLNHFIASFATLGATSAITNQFGHVAASTLTNATNNYGFYGNIASGTGRFNFYANGTAANVFAGTTSLGGLVGAEALRATPVASAVNYVNVIGAIATASPSLAAAGSDTNIDLTLTPKGTGVLKFGTYTAGILAQAGYITIKDAAGNTRNLLVG
jgi:hypothetical protein